MAGESQEHGYERLGHRKLTLVDVISQSVGFMGPVFSAAFLIPLIAGFSPSGKGAGVATPLAVLLAAVGTYALGWIVAQYAKRVHAAGSLYDYVSMGLGGQAGAATGWLYYGATTVLASAIAVLVGWFVHDVLFLGVFEIESPLPMWAWSAIYVAGVFLVMYSGIQISTRVQLALALVSAAALLAFFVKVIAEVGSANNVKVFNPAEAADGWSGIMFGVLYGVLIFVGFETAANLGEETAEPRRSIPRGVLLTVVIVGAFYLIASYAQVAGFGFDPNLILNPEIAAAPVFALSSPDFYGSDLILKIIEVVVLLDIMAVGLGAAVASTRGVFALARDRRIPAAAAVVSRRRGTPLGAIVFVEGVSVIMVVFAELWDGVFAIPQTSHYFAMFLWLSTFGGFCIMAVYGLLALGALRGLADHPKRAAVIASSIVGVATAIGAIFGGVYKQPNPTDLVWVYAVAWFVLGIVVTIFVKGREPASQVLPDLRSDAEISL